MMQSFKGYGTDDENVAREKGGPKSKDQKVLDRPESTLAVSF